MKFKEEIRKNMPLLAEDISSLCKINSVEGEPQPGMPFGEGPAKALNAMLEIGEKMGFKTTNYGNIVGEIEYGGGEEMLGILGHVDVVPAGEGWDHDPFGGEIVDGRIYGRGTTDDKGPVVAVLYALAAIKEAGIPLKRRVRVILGCDEESGWGCMDYYKKHEPMPDLAFTPDGEYPVVNSEKGLFHGYFKAEFPSKLRVSAGERPNVVPGSATAYLPLSLSDVLPAAEAYSLKSGFPISARAEGEGTVVTVTGENAHASIPHMGRNAIQALLQLLALLPLEGEDARMAEGLSDLLKMDMHGESLGLDVTDVSGRQTLNPGILQWNENGIEKLALDLRCPASRPLDEIQAHLEEKLAPLGLKLFDTHK